MQLFQSTVDVHGGTAAIFGSRQLDDFILFGDIPADLQSKMNADPVTRDLIAGFKPFANGLVRTPSSIKDSAGQALYRDGIKEIVKLFKTLNIVANDKYDEAGRRRPTQLELQRTVNNIRDFHKDSNSWVMMQLLQKAAYMKDSASKLGYVNEVAKLFFNQDYGKVTMDNRAKFIKDLAGLRGKKQKGEIQAIMGDKLFDIDPSLSNFDTFISNSQGGYILSNIVKSQIFNDSSAKNLPAFLKAGADQTMNYLTQATEVKKEIALRMLFAEGMSDSDKADAIDQIVDSESLFETQGSLIKTDASINKGANIKQAEELGNMHSILTIQRDQIHNMLRRSYGFKEAWRQEALLRDLSATENAISALEGKAMKNLIAYQDKNKNHVKFVKGLPKDARKFRTWEPNNNTAPVYVYKVFGNIGMTGDAKDTFDVSKVKFKNVKLHAIVDPKNFWKKEKGGNYFVVDNPIMPQSLSAKGVKEGYEFARAFASRSDFNPDKIFMSLNASDRLRGRMMKLKEELRKIRSSEIDQFVNQRALSKHAQGFDDMRTRAFVDFLFPQQGDGENVSMKDLTVFDQGNMDSSIKDPVLHLMGALLNPDAVQGKLVQVPGKKGEHLPYFRADMQLMKEVLNFLRKNDMEKTAIDIVDLWESARRHSTPDADNQIANLQKPYSANGHYRFEHLDEVMANTASDLLGYGFRDPLLNNILDQNPNRDGHYENIYTVDDRGQRQRRVVKVLTDRDRNRGCNY